MQWRNLTRGKGAGRCLWVEGLRGQLGGQGSGVVSQGCRNKAPQVVFVWLEGVKQLKFVLVILEAVSPRSRCGQVGSFQGREGESVRLSPGLGVAGHLWCSWAHGILTRTSVFIFTWRSPCVRLPLFSEDTVIGFEAHPAPV